MPYSLLWNRVDLPGDSQRQALMSSLPDLSVGDEWQPRIMVTTFASSCERLPEDSADEKTFRMLQRQSESAVLQPCEGTEGIDTI